MERSYFEERINPMWAKTLKFNDHVYSVPINAHRTNWLWYDKKIFDEVGVKAPETCDELLKLARKLKKQNQRYLPLPWGVGKGLGHLSI